MCPQVLGGISLTCSSWWVGLERAAQPAPEPPSALCTALGPLLAVQRRGWRGGSCSSRELPAKTAVQSCNGALAPPQQGLAQAPLPLRVVSVGAGPPALTRGSSDTPPGPSLKGVLIWASVSSEMRWGPIRIRTGIESELGSCGVQCPSLRLGLVAEGGHRETAPLGETPLLTPPRPPVFVPFSTPFGHILRGWPPGGDTGPRVAAWVRGGCPGSSLQKRRVRPAWRESLHPAGCRWT